MLRILLALTLAASLASAQTYEASSFERDSLHPRCAFDGQAATRWSAKFREKTGWIQVTYEEEQAFSEVVVRSGIRDLKGAPKDFTILAGKAADSLKKVKAVKGNDADPARVKFRKTKARVWRIDVSARINERWSPTITEIEFGPAAKTTEGEATASGGVLASTPGLAGHEPELAFDADAETAFEAAKREESSWIEKTFAEPRTFDAVSLFIHSEGGRGVPREFTVKYKKGRSFKKLATVRKSYTVRPRARFKKTTATTWRIEVSELIDDRAALQLNEVTFQLLGKGEWPKRPGATVDERDVNKAIDRGAKWLSERRRDDGNWGTSSTKEFPMGVMALCGLALKKSGLDRDDPLIQDLVSRMGAMPLEKTYSVALYAMFLRSVSIKRYNDRIGECAAFLVDEQGPEGLWGYPDGRSDLSNAQYALLGLKAAREVGVGVPDKTFEKAWDWLLDGARKDGGFNYVPTGKASRDPATGSMTAAALACFKICASQLPSDRTRASKSRKPIAEAMEWLGERFVVELNPGSGMSHYYYLYGVERVGSYFGSSRIGDHAWYPEGARHLLDWQWRDGSWHRNVIDTCFALLFLNRASLTGD